MQSTSGEQSFHNSLIHKLTELLRRSELDGVPPVFAAMASTPDEVLNSFGVLRRRFAAAGQLNLLLDLLLSNSATIFANTRLTRRVLALGADLNRQAQVKETVVRSSKVTGWGVNNRRAGSLRRLGLDDPQEVITRKYGEKLELAAPESVFDLAEKFAPKVRLQPSLLDILYRHRQTRAFSWSDWERHVRTAHCLDQIATDLEQALGGEHFRRIFTQGLVDDAAKRDAFAQIDPSKGTILISFHGFLVRVARALFEELFPDGVTIQKRRPRRRSSERHARIGVQDDKRAALFSGLRALQDRRVLLMAMDARYGTMETIKVLGVAQHVGVGAAFLAYESRCNTGWYSIVRQDRRLIPIIVPGPSRLDGERYDDFKERLLNFVATNIEAAVTGDPWNIALRSKWANLLGKNTSGHKLAPLRSASAAISSKLARLYMRATGSLRDNKLAHESKPKLLPHQD